MSADTALRLALLQRLPAGTAGKRATTVDDNCVEWQQLCIHCGVMPLQANSPTLPDLELNSLWPPPDPQQGFALLVAGNQAACAQARPLLEQLAPQPGAWLYCGPLGAASFCRRVFDTLFYLAGPLLQQHCSHAVGASRLPDWQALLRAQRQIADQLSTLCADYLQQHGSTPLPEHGAALLAAFQLPPTQQQHFALNLAQLLSLTLQLHDNAQQLFDTLLQATTMQKAR